MINVNVNVCAGFSIVVDTQGIYIHEWINPLRLIIWNFIIGEASPWKRKTNQTKMYCGVIKSVGDAAIFWSYLKLQHEKVSRDKSNDIE